MQFVHNILLLLLMYRSWRLLVSWLQRLLRVEQVAWTWWGGSLEPWHIRWMNYRGGTGMKQFVWHMYNSLYSDGHSVIKRDKQLMQETSLLKLQETFMTLSLCDTKYLFDMNLYKHNLNCVIYNSMPSRD